ncbi:MAG: phosphate signaling complex protein PhoU [Methylophaga sp.]|nr:phosphate signaling complex protein PhoU [Methylophaga sp.]
MKKGEDGLYGDHISKGFNDELANLNADFLKMGFMVMEQLNNAVNALIEGDTLLADEVRSKDKIVDKLELELDEEATRIIARRQPAAMDLRLLISVIKMVADLERVGDEAKKIAKLTLALSEEGHAQRGYVEVRHISSHVLSMLHDALDAFSRLDSEQALQVMKEDKIVDDEYKTATRSLLTFMMEDTRNISRCMSMMWVLRALERVGDHACNVAEYVIFMIEGEDIRHTSVKTAEKVIGKQ